MRQRHSIVCSGFIIGIVLLASMATASSPTVVVTNYSVSPTVLAPGEVGTITVTLTNTAQSATSSESDTMVLGGRTISSTRTTVISAEIQSVSLFGGDVKVLSGSYNDLAVLGPGQSIPVTFLIRAPDTPGIYFPEVWIRVLDGGSSNYPIPVNVNTQISVPREPAIVVQKTVPDPVAPGDRFSVGLVLFNGGMSGADNINLGIQSNSTSLLTLTPSTYHFNHLDSNQSIPLEIEFVTDKNARLGLVPIMLSLDYTAPDGSTKRQNEVIGIQVQGRAAMSIASVGTNPSRISAGDPVDLTIRIENIGTDDANSVSVSLDDLPLSGTHDAFLGRIEPNNDAPAVFSLEADRAGEYTYTLTIRFTDDYGDHTTRQTLRMIVGEDTSLGLILGIAGIAVLVVVGAVYWFRKRKGT